MSRGRIIKGFAAHPKLIAVSTSTSFNRWRQCWTCGVIVVYEAKSEVELDTLTEPRSNPFKFKSGEVKTGKSRKFDRTGKTQHKRKFKQDLEQADQTEKLWNSLI